MHCNQIYIHLLVPPLNTLTKGQDAISLPKNNYVCPSVRQTRGRSTTGKWINTGSNTIHK